MNLEQLKYFKELVETGSRNKTASHLGITPSTLSVAIGKLEHEVGTPLFRKTRGTVDLTSDGEVFYEYVGASLHFLNDGVRILRDRHSVDAPPLQISIGAVHSVREDDWARVMNLYRQATHGRVQVNVEQSTTQDLIQGLKAGAIDVAIAGTMGPDAQIASVPCWSQSAVLVVNKTHPFSRRKEVSLSELARTRLVSYSFTGPFGLELTNLVKGYDLSLDCRYSDEVTLASIVVGNPETMAIACRSWMLNAYSNEVSLVRITEAPENFHQMYLLYKAEVSQRPVVSAFIEAVEAHCAENKRMSLRL